jgi:Fe-S-cluster-containing hydrogenase component 2/CRP-like cAMP-binding protein
VSDVRQQLFERVEADVMACIGCNDCLLACPLPEARVVTIADLNTAVHQPVLTNRAVVTFVAACTQCRQCVPACPADLSRADIVLLNKMKVEDAIPDQPMLMQVGRGVVPSPWTIDTLARQLGNLPLFAGVAVTDVRALVLKATLRQLVAGETLVREGEFHERLYIVLHGGVVQWSASDRGGPPVYVLALPPGGFFGELAVMADQPEPFTVTSPAGAVVLELPKVAVLGLMDRSAAFKGTMDELYRRRALWTYARKPTGLGGFPDAAIQELLADAQLVVLKPGETLCREGDPPRDVYLVRSGFVRVSRKLDAATERIVLYLREGDLFGAMPFLVGERASLFTLEASSRAEVIRVPGATLQRVLNRSPDAYRALSERGLETDKVARSPTFGTPKALDQSGTVANLSMSVMVNQGLAKGHELLVIDQTKCTYCNNCVDACARRHGYSRLQLRGMQVENLLFPSACRHCEDPVCLLCSVNGIVRMPSGEITIVEDNCIGCGACAERCPYGNISMHAVTEKKRGFFLDLLDLVRGGAARDRALAELDPRTEKIAVKCDLCAGHDDYACVTACPVGAAFRTDPQKIFAGKKDVVIGLEMKKASR